MLILDLLLQLVNAGLEDLDLLFERRRGRGVTAVEWLVVSAAAVPGGFDTASKAG